MAKYNITYSCGHDGYISLVGPYKDRDRKIEWLEESGLCPECWKAKKDNERTEEYKSAAEKSSQKGLPPITGGTEKQNAWAEKIRCDAVVTMGDFKVSNWASNTESTLTYLTKYSDWRFGENIGRKFYDWLVTQTDAKFWIDTRPGDDDANANRKNTIALWLHDNLGLNVISITYMPMWYKRYYAQVVKGGTPTQLPEFATGKKWNGRTYNHGRTVYLDGEKTSIDSDQSEQANKYAQWSDITKSVNNDYDVRILSESPEKYPDEFWKWLSEQTCKKDII